MDAGYWPSCIRLRNLPVLTFSGPFPIFDLFELFEAAEASMCSSLRLYSAIYSEVRCLDALV